LRVANAGRNWTWIGVTLETYRTTNSNCGLYPHGSTRFYDFEITALDGSAIRPNWRVVNSDQCGGTSTVHSWDDVSISTN